MRKRVRDNTGIALVTVLLIAAVAAAFVLILAVPLYQQHLRDARLTMDIQSVQTCEDVASVRYLQDGATGLRIYYYDERSHQCLDRDRIGTIVPYGRSSREQNTREETGARGIPNLGEDHGGPQLLSVAVDAGEKVNIRWTGHDWRYLDYYYMYPEERATLTEDIYREMDRDSLTRAKKAALQRYREDFRKSLRRQEDPGTATYLYDALQDTAVYDQESQAIPAKEKGTAITAMDLAAYGMSGTDEAEGCVIRVRVSYDAEHAQETAETAWVEGSHG